MTAVQAASTDAYWQVGADRTLTVAVSGKVTAVDLEAGTATLGKVTLPIRLGPGDEDLTARYVSAEWPDTELDDDGGYDEGYENGLLDGRKEASDVTRLMDLIRRFHDYTDDHQGPIRYCRHPLCEQYTGP